MSDFGSPLFVHSTPDSPTRKDHDKNVAIIVQQAWKTPNLHPDVKMFIESIQSTFCDVFIRQIDLINSRSQNLRDNEITVFDKALLVLTEHPDCQMTPAAVKFFCQEYLNLELLQPVSLVTHTLQQSVQLPEMLKQALPPLSDDATMTDQEPSVITTRPPPLDTFLREDMEPKLATMWSVYESARNDYSTALDIPTGKEKTIRVAKFLRDTAENIIMYLENKYTQNKTVDSLMLAELKTTFTHAKTTVVCLTGGKNRKFDRAEINKGKDVPRGPSLPKSGREEARLQPYARPAEFADRRASIPPASSYDLKGSDHVAHGNGGRSQTRYSERSPYREPNHYQDDYALAPVPSRERGRRASRTDDIGQRYSYTVTTSGAEHYRRRDDHQSADRNRAGYDKRRMKREPNPRRDERSASPDQSSRQHRAARHHYRRRSPSQDRTQTRRARSPSRLDDTRHRVRDSSVVSTREAGHSISRRRPSIPMKGRGHSGIPYGYTSRREVDSYVPSRDRDWERDLYVEDAEV